jgi:methylmalonyl-CoA/ethylmalonyl-CoA epimerase|tara:strand:- start:6027 stop:6428 length:402 start_codon:yes stop_codon:yes gene_type:complete
MIRVEHIGIAVKDLKKVNDLYSRLFNQSPYKEERVASEAVNTSFFQIGETKIEFLESDQPDSAISKYVDKNRSGIHHIAFEVADIQLEIDRLKGEGFVIIYNPAKLGADNKLITFLHPKSTNGVLVELCQELK